MLRKILLIPILLLLSNAIVAKPWISPNDMFLRSDIQLLSDAGVITVPVTTWPLNWTGIKQNIFAARNKPLNRRENEARQRLLRRCKFETRTGKRKSYSIIGSSGVSITNSFGNGAHDGGQLIGNTDWLGKRYAFNLQATTVVDPEDGDHLRFDGSYAAVVLDNWILSIGVEERWWGPGWNDSLILGSNSRPLPAISVRRNNSTPAENDYFKWLGPWHFDSFISRLESEREIANALMFGMRFSAKPISNLELGLSRVSLWGGEGKSKNLSAFFSAFRGDSSLDGEEGGVYSLGSIDMRYALNTDYALYAQVAETTGGVGAGRLGLIGVESSLSTLWPDSEGKIYFEVVDTNIDNGMSNSYRGVNYQTGHYYKNRPLGASFLGQSITMGGMMSLSQGRQLFLALTHADIESGFNSGDVESDAELFMISTKCNAMLFNGYISLQLDIYSKELVINEIGDGRYSAAVHWSSPL